MVPLAPRYDPLVLDAVRELDDRTVPIAEVARRVGDATGRLGLIRPSYVHLRRLVLAERAEAEAERARREAIREIVLDVTRDVIVGLPVNAYEVADRVRDAGR